MRKYITTVYAVLKERPDLEKILMYFLDKKPNKYTSSLYKRLANLTQYIEYDCKFTDGRCKKASRFLDDSRCCCAACKDSKGYFEVQPFEMIPGYKKPQYAEYLIDVLSFYKERFDEENFGYWREGKGCILPREHRSITCLMHNCKIGSFNKAENLILDALSDFRKFSNDRNLSLMYSIVNLLESHYKKEESK